MFFASPFLGGMTPRTKILCHGFTQAKQSFGRIFQVIRATPPDLPTDARELSQICHRHWREGITAGLELVRGTLKAIDLNKAFTFIKRDDGGEDVFVLLRDIPKKCSYEGAKV